MEPGISLEAGQLVFREGDLDDLGRNVEAAPKDLLDSWESRMKTRYCPKSDPHEAHSWVEGRDAGKSKRRSCPGVGALFEPPAQLHSVTSVAAAKEIKPHAAKMRAEVLKCIEVFGPVTDEHIAEFTGLNPSTARPRRIELVAAGLVMAAPRTQKTHAGRNATAWIARSDRP